MAHTRINQSGYVNVNENILNLTGIPGSGP